MKTRIATRLADKYYEYFIAESDRFQINKIDFENKTPVNVPVNHKWKSRVQYNALQWDSVKKESLDDLDVWYDDTLNNEELRVMLPNQNEQICRKGFYIISLDVNGYTITPDHKLFSLINGELTLK